MDAGAGGSFGVRAADEVGESEEMECGAGNLGQGGESFCVGRAPILWLFPGDGGRVCEKFALFWPRDWGNFDV